MSMQGVEPWFQELRIGKIWQHLPKNGVLVDLGCDEEMTLLKKLSGSGMMKRLVGLDLVTPSHKKGDIEIVQADLTKPFPVKGNTADVVTMLAVLEHLPDPVHVMSEVYRILKPGGVFLVTVPSARAEKVLPTLAKFNIVRQEMIDQHYHYFTHDKLRKLARKAGFRDVVVESWEFGFNTFLKAVK